MLSNGKNREYEEIIEKLQIYIDVNVFDVDAKEDIEGYVEDLK